jgi:hypothetical protein
VPVEAVRLVLREHDDLREAGVQQVREREVDQAVHPAERDGRLRTVLGERHEALPLAAGEDDAEYLLRWHGAHRTPKRRSEYLMGYPESQVSAVIGAAGRQ